MKAAGLFWKPAGDGCDFWMVGMCASSPHPVPRLSGSALIPWDPSARTAVTALLFMELEFRHAEKTTRTF